MVKRKGCFSNGKGCSQNFEKGTVAELHPLLRPLMVWCESQGSLLYGEWGHPIEAEGSYFKTSDVVGEAQLLKLPSP